MDTLPPGAVLHDGEFIIESVAARSVFGITYRARDNTLCRDVAIKEYFPAACRRTPDSLDVVPDELLGHDQFERGRERFLEEARALAMFHHPNIVEVHGFFQQNNTAYMTMEWLEGETLQERLSSNGPLREREVLELAQTLCDALEVVHDAGRLHRDIKPDNILLCADKRVVIVDFGLSTQIENHDSYGTRPLDETLRFGTPGYAPLEQYTRDRPARPSSDIYALGATLYHALTGRVPPPATDRAFGESLPAPHELHPEISPAISAAVMGALALKPEARPGSARAFAKRLQHDDALANAAAPGAKPLQPPPQTPTPTYASTRAATGDVVLPDTSPPPRPEVRATDETGCFQAAFALYFILWCLAAMICAGAVLARIALFGI